MKIPLVFNINRCNSKVGRQGGSQTVSFDDDCFLRSRASTIKHEFMHAVGFWHEHSRTDRDEYVKIFNSNIQPGNAYH